MQRDHPLAASKTSNRSVVTWRRPAILYLSRILAPHPQGHIRPRQPVVVVGALRAATGLGRSARLCYAAIAEAGMDTYGIDIGRYFRQDCGAADFAYRDGRGVAGPGTILLHVNAPFIPYALALLGRRVVAQNFLVGYWAWELPWVPAEWQHGASFVHAIWVPSRFTAAAVAPVANGRPVDVVAHPIAVPAANAVRRRNSGVLRVLSVFHAGSSGARKNPLAAIDAFKRAFGVDPEVRLTVAALGLDRAKTVASELRAAVAGHRNIAVDERVLPDSQVHTRYEAADVLISLHRSEGFGLAVAEAMAHGLVVVATNWSGTVDFLTPENGVPIIYDLIPATDPQGTYDYPTTCWAEPNVLEAANALRRLRLDHALRIRLAERAVADIRTTLSRERYAARVRQLLQF